MKYINFSIYLALCMAPDRVEVTVCVLIVRTRKHCAEFDKLEIIISANGQFRMCKLQNILSEVANKITCGVVELA